MLDMACSPAYALYVAKDRMLQSGITTDGALLSMETLPQPVTRVPVSSQGRLRRRGSEIAPLHLCHSIVTSSGCHCHISQ